MAWAASGRWGPRPHPVPLTQQVAYAPVPTTHQGAFYSPYLRYWDSLSNWWGGGTYHQEGSAHHCCDSEGEILAYVGGGRGQFNPVTEYKYVGAGGQYDVIRIPAQRSWCIWCCPWFLCAVVFVSLVCGFLSGGPVVTETTTTTTGTSFTTLTTTSLTTATLTSWTVVTATATTVTSITSATATVTTGTSITTSTTTTTPCPTVWVPMPLCPKGVTCTTTAWSGFATLPPGAATLESLQGAPDQQPASPEKPQVVATTTAPTTVPGAPTLDSQQHALDQQHAPPEKSQVAVTTRAPAATVVTTSAVTSSTVTSVTDLHGPVRCKDFSEWPQKDGGAQCGVCKHLVLIGEFHSCDEYCANFGQACFYAAEDKNGPEGQLDCAIERVMQCGDDLRPVQRNSHDMVCGCRYPEGADAPPPVAASLTTTSTTTLPATTTAAPLPLPEQPANLRCKDFSEWPRKDGDAECGTCRHMAHVGEDAQSCAAYCATFRHACFYAAESRANPEARLHCEVDRELPCDEDMPLLPTSSKGMVCGCRELDEAEEAPQEDTPPLQCADFSAWPSATGSTGCGACVHRISLWEPGERRSCEAYCSSFGHACFSAAEATSQPDCGVEKELQCTDDMREEAAADMLCGCRLLQDKPTVAPPGGDLPSSQDKPTAAPPGVDLPSSHDKPTAAPPGGDPPSSQDKPTVAPPGGDPPSSPVPCTDTPDWANGDDSCIREGFGLDQGCSDRGWQCKAYSRHAQEAWCVDGAVVPGMETVLGEVHNFPEKNCCVCGGGQRAPPRAALQLDAGDDSAAPVQTS